MKFHEYDAEFSPAMRNLVTGVVTKKETNEVKRMLFGTWDSVIFWEDPIKTKSDDLQVVFAEAETLSKGILYDDRQTRCHAERICSAFIAIDDEQRSFARDGHQMSTNDEREKLWMAIQSAIRYSKKLGHLGNLLLENAFGIRNARRPRRTERHRHARFRHGLGDDHSGGHETSSGRGTSFTGYMGDAPPPPPKLGMWRSTGAGLFNRITEGEKEEEETEKKKSEREAK